MKVDTTLLGRRISVDERDRNYPMQAVLRPVAPGVTYRYWYPNGEWTNQGATGTCVGHAWGHWVEDGPITHDGKIDPYEIYREACKRDPWPENDGGDLNFGTSVRAAAQYLVEVTRVTEYRWAWDLNTVVHALLTDGPVVIGSWWWDSMFNPDPDGTVHVEGNKAGGHAYVLNGVNTDRQIVRMKNSWGRGWGKNGYGYIAFEDLNTLLTDQGEACLAVETATRR